MRLFNEYDLGRILEVCMDFSHGKRLDMLESFQLQYEEKGDLSDRQKEILSEILDEERLWDELDQ
jgi:hypothetical protein